MAVYCERSDIEAIYGRANVKKWADLDNRNDAADIAARIDRACVVASEQVDMLLIGGPYALPFETEYPVVIVDIAARLAAYRLYEGRAAEDTEEGKVDFASIKKNALADLARIRAGVMRINSVDDLITRVPRLAD